MSSLRTVLPPRTTFRCLRVLVKAVSTEPRARARTLRERAGTDANVVDPHEVIQLLRYPDRDVQRNAAAALLGIVTEYPDAGRNAVDRLSHLLETLEESAPAEESVDERAAFGQRLLVCLARVATYDAERVLEERAVILARLDPDESACENPTPGLTATASVCLVQLVAADPTVFAPHADRFVALLDAEETATRRHAAHVLSELADSHPAVVAPGAEALRDCLDDDDPETVTKASSTLGKLARESPDDVVAAIPTLVELLDHDAKRVRANAAGVVADVAANRPAAVSESLPALCDTLEDDADPVRRHVATAFTRVAATVGTVPNPVDGALIELLDDPDPMVRAQSCRALGHTETPAALELLRATARTDDEPGVREAARWATERITG